MPRAPQYARFKPKRLKRAQANERAPQRACGAYSEPHLKVTLHLWRAPENEPNTSPVVSKPHAANTVKHSTPKPDPDFDLHQMKGLKANPPRDGYKSRDERRRFYTWQNWPIR
jgi:hypothetical protein